MLAPPLFVLIFMFNRSATVPCLAMACTSHRARSEDHAMARCETCGNDYDKPFEITAGGQRHTFDSFECAIHKLAPSCAHCGCKVVGHGVEAHGTFFCCASCARMAGEHGVSDRAA
jgi:hypothetical protein